MPISSFFIELKQRNALLFYFGCLNILLFFICYSLYLFSEARVMGINVWIKPMKFALSIAMYVLTFGWLLAYLRDYKKRIVISWVVLISMAVEMVVIFYQASRGQLSHYNISSGFNAFLFGTMGTFIGINSVINLFTVMLFFNRNEVSLRDAELLAWRMGLLIFFLGGLSGGWMISQMAHTVGAPDGGPGLPFVNWSTVAGDIRVAHFVTLHGLQVIPLVTFWLAARSPQPVKTVWWFSVFYILICIALHALALAGLPIISQ